MTRLFRSAFLAAALFLAFDQALASKVITAENRNVRPNAGIVEMPVVSVSDEVGLPNSLSGATKFSLVLSTEANVRLSRTSLTSVSVSPATVRAVSVSDDLRTLSFESSVPLASDTLLSVSGIKVIAYNRYSPLHGFDLDVGSDGTVDAYDQNGIRVTDEYGAQDLTAPQDPVAVSGSFTAGTVTLSAQPSGDLDFENFRVAFETASGVELGNSTQTALVARTFDLVANTAVVRVQSVDRTGNVSTGVLLWKATPATSTSSGTTSSGSVSSSGSTTSTGTSSTDSVSVGTSDGTSSSTGITLDPLYVPLYKSVPLVNVIAAMDRFIAAQTKTSSDVSTQTVRVLRNDLAKSLESFYKTRVTAKKRLLVGQIRAKAAVLKNALLK